MGNMQKDGISGYISDHVDTDRTVDIRPKDHPFVRVTHFPYDEFHMDHDAVESEDWDTDEGPPYIPLGEAYEVTIWDSPEDIRDSYIAVNGVEAACQQAIDVAIEEGLPVWDTILRLRPRTILVEHTPMKTVSGEYTTAVMETENENWVAIDRESGLGGWGPTKEDAIENLDERRESHADAENRTGEIVQTDDVLGGAPRVAGSRIGVTHIVDMAENRDSIPEVAASFVGPLTIDEVTAALDWADEHPEEIEAIRERQRDIQEDVLEMPDDTRDGDDTDSE